MSIDSSIIRRNHANEQARLARAASEAEGTDQGHSSPAKSRKTPTHSPIEDDALSLRAPLEDATDVRDLEYRLEATNHEPTVHQDCFIDWSQVPEKRHFGPYELLSIAGQGGMGIIYQARHQDTQAVVALKLMQNRTEYHPSELKRFKRECSTMANLCHANIMPILDQGCIDGIPYFAMPLMAKGSLLQHVLEYLDQPRIAVRIMIKVCRAIEYAHQQGVVHRDLKTSNILLDECDEPYLADFGLAKRLDKDSSITQAGEVFGTMAYISPEQSSGHRSAEIGFQSDIWSLGVILYEVLTGELPFRENRHTPLVMQIMTFDPTPANKINQKVDARLNGIIERCLEKNGAHRYQSAAKLANDLEAWLHDQPIDRSTRSWSTRLRRSITRHRSLLSLSLLFLLITFLTIWLGQSKARPAFSNAENHANTANDFKQQLTPGQPSYLVDEQGTPKTWLQLCGTGMVQTDSNDYLTCASDGECLIELLPGPVSAYYKLRAQIKFGAGNATTRFGLYVNHSSRDTPQGMEHFFALLNLSEGNPAQARMQLDKVRLFETHDKKIASDMEESPVRMDYSMTEHTWQNIEWEITPTRSILTFNGMVIGQMQPTLTRLQKLPPMSVQPQVDQPFLLAATGGIGIYVAHGTGYFRNISIEPMRQKKNPFIVVQPSAP